MFLRRGGAPPLELLLASDEGRHLLPVRSPPPSQLGAPGGSAQGARGRGRRGWGPPATGGGGSAAPRHPSPHAPPEGCGSPRFVPVALLTLPCPPLLSSPRFPLPLFHPSSLLPSCPLPSPPPSLLFSLPSPPLLCSSLLPSPLLSSPLVAHLPCTSLSSSHPGALTCCCRRIRHRSPLPNQHEAICPSPPLLHEADSREVAQDAAVAICAIVRLLKDSDVESQVLPAMQRLLCNCSPPILAAILSPQVNRRSPLSFLPKLCAPQTLPPSLTFPPVLRSSSHSRSRSFI